MPAPCGSCGNTVLTYGQLWRLAFRPTTWAESVKVLSSAPYVPHVKCAHCGVEVVQRHYRTVNYGFAALCIIVLVATLFLTDAWQHIVAVCFGLVVVAAAEGYWAWRALPWDAVQPSAAAPPAPPPAG